MHPNTERVVRAAAARGLSIEVREFPEDTRTAPDAARAIGCDLGQIVKSLVFTIDGAPVVLLVSGANRVDEAKLAAAVGGGVVDRATAGTARAATGYPIGGVPPFAHDRVLRTLVDDDLMAFDVVWAAAGTPRAVFAIEPEELVRLSAASGADLAQRDGG
jgi:prolyl-tRNA editing enzyme YbaK/EbsC (Cys-tRNA(Pro) deacylase)